MISYKIQLATIIAVLYFNLSDGQVYNGRKFYSSCRKAPYNGIPYYPCHDWNPVKRLCQHKDLRGNDITNFNLCVECIKRDAEKPYPRHLPRCPKDCGPGEEWCDMQEICLSDSIKCECSSGDVYCTYFSSLQQVEKYRCLSETNHRSLVEKGTFQKCLDGSCKADCGEIGILRERTSIDTDEDQNNKVSSIATIADQNTNIDSKTKPTVFKTTTNSTTVTASDAPPLVLILGGSAGGILFIICLLLAVCFIKRKIRNQTNDDVELQDVTMSAHISLPKNQDTKSILERILDYNWKIANDFRDIEEFASGLEKSTRQARKHRKHNRHRDALPFDDNVITLSNPAGTPKTTYVNASPIRFDNMDQTFISTQIPTPASTQNFWMMVMEHNVSVLILLDSRSIQKFWPDRKESLLKISGESVTVRYLKHSYTGSFYRRQFALVGRGERRFIDMLHIEGWGDSVVPSTTKPMLNVLYEAQDLIQERPGRIVTVCSNGADRCGTYIALHKLVEDYKDNQVERLDAFGTVLSLREQRQKMVGREDHFEFVLEGLCDFITAQEVEYDASEDSDRREMNHAQGSGAQETGWTCSRIFSSTWDIATSAWLIGDMSLDIRTTRMYHEKMVAGSLDPAYFIGSVVAHVAPVLGIAVMSWLYLAYVIRRPKTRHYVQTIVFTLLAPLIWAVTPFMALVAAFFGALGINVTSEHRVNDSHGNFRRFITYVMIVKAIEQFLEALPQVIISGLYIDSHGIEDNIVTLLSCIASSGSLVFFLGKNVYDVVNNYESSVIGLIAKDRVSFP